MHKLLQSIVREFVSEEKRDYRFKIGYTIASALTGFLVGAASASVVWYFAVIAG